MDMTKLPDVPDTSDPAPRLPPYFYPAPGGERVLHSTLDVATFGAPVKEHEHRWVTPVVLLRDEGYGRLARDAADGPWGNIPLSAVFCAYPHCEARP